MKLISMACPRCNAIMQVNSELKQCTCQYCGNVMLIDHEIKNSQISNGYELGYEFEKGRIRAQSELKPLSHETNSQKDDPEPLSGLLVLTTICILIYMLIVMAVHNTALSVVSWLWWLACAISYHESIEKENNIILSLMRGYFGGGTLAICIKVGLWIISWFS